MRALAKIILILLAILVWYLFVALCAWNPDPGHWSGFARFFWAIMIILSIGTIIDR